MDLGKLRAFITVAEQLNFRKSAEILGMSQPPLTRLISSLEDELGTALFERTTRNVSLTGAGVFLLKEAREMVAKSDLLEEEIRRIGKLKSGEISIGFSFTTFLVTVSKIVADFEARFPKVKIHLKEDGADGLLKALANGKLDIAFIEGKLEAKEFSSLHIQSEAIGVMLPKGHPLAKKKELRLKDLKDETVILHPQKEHRGFYDGVLHLFAQEGLKPATHIKQANESCPVLVATGKGVSLNLSNRPTFNFPGVTFVPIELATLPVSAYWSPGNKNTSLKSIISFVVESPAMRTKDFECLIDAMKL